ncbi:hypothetical protein [Sorangium sp. So ce1151]|uniref:hypothetical protein n=1 Tax=Sorangium sp. So ce1151 TaxID=3133332 RepID=UPI003F602EF3
MGVQRGHPDLLVDERRERRVKEAGDVPRAPQALRAARAGGVHAPAELEGGSQAGRRLEGELGALRQRDGRQARKGREVLDREGATAEVRETEHQLQQGRVGHRGDVGRGGAHRAPPRAEGRSTGASALQTRRR